MSRRLRSALDIVSDIGVLGFDLQRHNEKDIHAAVTLLRTANPEMFDWIVQQLQAHAPKCLCTDLRTDEHGRIRAPHPDCPTHPAAAVGGS